jgi:hypothetical protein
MWIAIIFAHRFTTDGVVSYTALPYPVAGLSSLSTSHIPVLDKDRSYLPHFVNDMVELLRRIDSQREFTITLRLPIACQFRHNGIEVGSPVLHRCILLECKLIITCPSNLEIERSFAVVSASASVSGHQSVGVAHIS